MSARSSGNNDLLKSFSLCCIGLWYAAAGAAAATETCLNEQSGAKQLLWGDLHVHTAYSMDAYAFGAIATPEDAYSFARGQALELATGEMVELDRPLDFAAVTDHAESFDVMYLCTDPVYSIEPYCRDMRAIRDARESRKLFNEFLLPIVAAVPPEVPPVCARPGVDCPAASISQWQRTKDAANQANEPCNFTAFIGYEWSASPNDRHWHRNVIYRSEVVPQQVFDYVRFPEVGQLWSALDRSCLENEGCQVLTIPHNINWSEGGNFDVEIESRETQTLRRRFERIAEIHQEKGNSECMPADPEDAGADCAFEQLTPRYAQQELAGANAAAVWERLRAGHYRSLLSRGLAALDSSNIETNPLMLGAIGSTDTHFGTPGNVVEQGFNGGIAMLRQPDAVRLKNSAYNPGGLVAVWAESNTRSSIFDAMQRREVYATSGPRISVRFGTADAAACNSSDLVFTTGMGGILSSTATPVFAVLAGQDQIPLAAIEIIKGELIDGQVRESVTPVATFETGKPSVCMTWRDDGFDASRPAYWYVRVLEQPTPRWSKLLCQRLNNCADYPQANRMIQERAWTSPIWHLPGGE
jgi:hypothetical protein